MASAFRGGRDREAGVAAVVVGGGGFRQGDRHAPTPAPAETALSASHASTLPSLSPFQSGQSGAPNRAEKTPSGEEKYKIRQEMSSCECICLIFLLTKVRKVGGIMTSVFSHKF